MDVSRLRVGVIGCGWIAGLVHLPNLARRGDVQVVAVADPDERRRAAAAGRFPHAAAHASAGPLLADHSVEAVLIAAPPAAAAGLVEAALAAGKHVYVEKPMAASAAAGRRVAEAWRRSGRVAMVGYNFRFSPVFEAALARVRAGEIGALTTVQAAFTWNARPEAWRADPQAGGGALFDLASHHLDLFALLTGAAPRIAWARERAERAPADTVDLVAEAPDGPTLQLHASLAAGASANRLVLHGTGGRLEVDLLDPVPRRPVRVDGATRAARLGQAVRPLHPGRLLARPGYEPSFARALDVFLSACRGGAQPQPDPDAGVAALDALEAARRWARPAAATALESA